MPDYIALAIPFFFLLIAAELGWAHARGMKVYRFSRALADVSCGVMSQLAVVLVGASSVAAYAWLYERLRLVTLPDPWLGWLLAFVGVDLAYYWWHRASHRMNFLWAAHIVHHQSEDYNLAVALRQAILTTWTSTPFYAVLALLGIPPVPFLTARAFSTLYQFWIHTQLVRPLAGPVAYVFNLPSDHRVHHAINPRYLDKNFGATLLVWDRWFGTYERETDAPSYGITKPLASLNPLWAQVHYWVELSLRSARAPRRVDRLRVWWMPPDWVPQGGLPEPATTPEEVHERTRSHAFRGYLLGHYALLIIAATLLIFYATQLPNLTVQVVTFVLLLTLLSVAALTEDKRWAWPLELIRLTAALALVASLCVGWL